MNKTILVATILTILLLTTQTHAITQTIEDPANIEELKVKITQSGTISVSSGTLEWVKINISMPQDNDNQDLITSETLIEDPEGNKILTIYKEAPSNTIKYTTESTVTISERRTLEIPDTYTIPKELEQYKEPTTYIQSDNEKIIALAKQLTESEDTDFERIASLATWVHDNVEYKIALGSTAQDAVWTYENRIGTCDEFSSLFIALARAAGYPARYISGWAYGNDGWERHAFAEVYIGTWVPVDPTWNEVGNLDATHIAFAKRKDTVSKNEVQVYGTKLGEITWDKDDTEIEIISITEKQKNKDYELISSTETYRQGEQGVIILKFTPQEYKVVTVDLEPCISTNPIATVEDKEKTIILKPDTEEIIYWLVETSSSLQRNMLYTCPLTLNSRLLSLKTVNVTINTASNNNRDEIEITPTIEKEDMILGETQTITINAEKTNGNDPSIIGIIYENTHYQEAVELEEGQNTIITKIFAPKTSGEKQIITYSSLGDVKTGTYNVETAGDIYIEDMEIPEYAQPGETIEVKITIKNSRPTQETLKITTTSETDTQTTSIPVSSRETITQHIEMPDNTGDTKITIHLTGKNIDTKTSRTIRIYNIPQIELYTTYDYDNNILKITATTTQDLAKEISLTVGEQTKTSRLPTSEETFEFKNIEEGTYEIKISYKDYAGDEHEKETTITIEEQKITDKIGSYLKDTEDTEIETGIEQDTTDAEIYIKEIDAPKYSKIGEIIPIGITIKNRQNTEETIELTTEFEDTTQKDTISIKDEKTITKQLTGLNAGYKKITFKIAYGTEEYTKTQVIRIYDKPEIRLYTDYDEKTRTAKITAYSSNDMAKNITITINGQTQSTKEASRNTEFTIALEEGKYTARLTYADYAGNKYTEEKEITIKKQNIIEKIISYIKKLLQ